MRSAILQGAAALATFALVLTAAADAGATTVLTTALAAPFNQVSSCIVTNIDTRPITVRLQLIDPTSGTPEGPFFSDCPPPPATLPPGLFCHVEVPLNVYSYCVVTTSSAKVRAAIDVFNATTGRLEAHIPATK